jgi:GAF domain-containing protein
VSALNPLISTSHARHTHHDATQDWDGLYRVAGIRSFMAVPIGVAGEVLGLLTIAKHEPGAFNDEW